MVQELQTCKDLTQPSEILELVFTVIGQVLDNRNLFIALYDEAHQNLSFPIYAIDGKRYWGAERPFGNGIADYVIRTNAPLVIKRDLAEALERLRIDPIVTSPCSLLAVPLRVGDKAIGVIALQDYEREDRYDEDDLQLLTTMAAQAAIALKDARFDHAMRRELEERQAQQSALDAMIAAASQESATIEAVMNTALDQTLGAFHLDTGSIWLSGMPDLEPVCVSRGALDQTAAGMEPPSHDQNPSPSIVIPDWAVRGRSVDEMEGFACTGTSISVPLLAGGRRLGDLTIGAPQARAWSKTQVAFCETVGRELGMTIERLHLFEQTTQRAGQLALLCDAGLALNQAFEPQAQLEQLFR